MTDTGARTATTTTRRSYRSQRRAQQAARTREAVLAAATYLFSTRGWSGTAMRDVAAEADVSVETVYSGFGSKIDLLLAAVDVGVVGDDEPVALAERPEFTALGQGSLTERAAAGGRLTAAVNQRTAGLHRALRQAAGADPSAAARLREIEERRRTTVEKGAALAAGRPVTAEERDGVWAVTGSEVYDLLVETSGWPVARYEAWVGDTVRRLLTR